VKKSKEKKNMGDSPCTARAQARVEPGKEGQGHNEEKKTSVPEIRRLRENSKVTTSCKKSAKGMTAT